jgi:protoporphyrinogen oxidase
VGRGVRPPRDQTDTTEGWIVARFGWRLYQHFFKTYNEKVWGVPGQRRSRRLGGPADQEHVPAERVGSTPSTSSRSTVPPAKRKATDITSLIEEFQYPKYGPGQMWERVPGEGRGRRHQGPDETRVVAIRHEDRGAVTVVAATDGVETEYPCDDVISSMPMSQLVQAMDPPVPADVLEAADDLAFRDFLSVALVVPESASFPDNWIYIHAPEVEVGVSRTSGLLVALHGQGRADLPGPRVLRVRGRRLVDRSNDDDLIERGKRELAALGPGAPSDVEAGYVVRMPKAYPFYDEHYKRNVERLRDWLADCAPNVHPVGRNGMHRYNNQDHSMYTAMLSVENMVGGRPRHLGGQRRGGVPRGATTPRRGPGAGGRLLGEGVDGRIRS